MVSLDPSGNHRSMTTNGQIAVELLSAEASREVALVEQLTDLINRVYAVAEQGLWRDGATRTTASEISGLIAAGEIAVAAHGGEIVGSVRIHDVAADASEFGILVADPEQRGIGIGVALLDFVEARGRERGLRAMQLELLVPREWEHPSKEFLKAWYGRRGYRVIRTGTIEDQHPQLAPLLATPCDMLVYEKPL
jgi:GNAT superfamily N-acetyltransferase